jgi:nucleoside-diphosphate-sugar epimerase
MKAVLGEAKYRMEMYVHMFVQLHPDSRTCVVIPGPTYGRGLTKKVTFWDLLLSAWLEGKFEDFPSSFIHVDDVAEAFVAVVHRWEDSLENNAGRCPG